MSKTDPIFIAYAKSAPREDLRVYVRYAERYLTTYDLPDQAVRVIADMSTLLAQLETIDGTPAQRARVLSLITRFKASIPDWAQDPWRHGRPLERLERKCTARGLSPATLERLRAWYCMHLKTTASVPVEFKCLKCAKTLPIPRAHSGCDAPCRGELIVKREQQEDGRCRPRPFRLTGEQVQELLHGSAPEAVGITPKAKPVNNWRERAIAAEARVKELERGIAATAPATTPARRVAATTERKSAVDWRAAGLKAAETRRRNLAAKLAQEGAAA